MDFFTLLFIVLVVSFLLFVKRIALAQEKSSERLEEIEKHLKKLVQLNEKN